LSEPVVKSVSSEYANTVEDTCMKLHCEYKEKFRYASVLALSAKHDVQNIGFYHVLNDDDDDDVLTIVISR